MAYGHLPYESFWPDTSAFSGFTSVAGIGFGTHYQFTVAGRLVGLRIAQSGAASNKLLLLFCQELNTSGVQVAVGVAKPDTRSSNKTMPGWRNVYLYHPMRITIGNYYRVCAISGGTIERGIAAGFAATAATTRGHITLPKDAVISLVRNSCTRSTDCRFPNAAMPTPGDVVGLDVLFFPD